MKEKLIFYLKNISIKFEIGKPTSKKPTKYICVEKLAENKSTIKSKIIKDIKINNIEGKSLFMG